MPRYGIHLVQAILLTVVGVVLIVAALLDVFRTLFHPAASGGISDWIARQLWRTFRSVMPQWLSSAGPVIFVVTIFYWTASVVVGFALVYLPRLPHAFSFALGLNASNYSTFMGAIDVSIGSLITLSTGTYSNALWIQFLMGVESIFGFGLLTASVSWILSIYPAIEHKRSLAHQATLLHFAEEMGIRRLEDVADSELQQMLLGLASQLSTHRNELTQFPITYYFHENESKTALAGILPYIAEVAERSLHRKGGVAIAATTLGGAVDDYLKSIAMSFLRRPFTSRNDILRAFAYDHLREMVHSPQRVQSAA